MTDIVLTGPSGFTNNIKISPTVSNNDLVVTILTSTGGTPSSTDPAMVRIGITDRYITTALSVTKADGTNWANLGSAELGTKETDLFLYAVWNTNLTPDAVDIFWSRYPYGRLYSDFSSTTTNEKYAAINGTAPASTDECVVIGRFAATLSLSGTSHLWTVPTYTNINLIHQPITNTRMLTWQPVASAVGGGSFSISTTDLATYQIDKNWLSTEIHVVGTVTGTVTAVGLTAPFESLWISSTLPIGNSKVSGGLLGNAEMAAGTPDIIRHFKYDGSAFSTGASVVKSIGRYEI